MVPMVPSLLPCLSSSLLLLFTSNLLFLFVFQDLWLWLIIISLQKEKFCFLKINSLAIYSQINLKCWEKLYLFIYWYCCLLWYWLWKSKKLKIHSKEWLNKLWPWSLKYNSKIVLRLWKNNMCNIKLIKGKIKNCKYTKKSQFK